MFGGHRKKVTQQTINMVRQPYAVLQNSYGIPPGFWDDEFVLGFFGVMSGLLLRFLGEGRLNQADSGRILQDTFSALSNMNGAEMAVRFSQFAQAQASHEAFRNGADSGEIVTVALLGKTTPAARQILDNENLRNADLVSRTTTDNELLTLITLLFLKPIVERFDLE
ncbi:hypothetical protein ACEN2J_10715 [Pseudorhodobacter sp. W20_MBD10_FR17]|uniref:hypothetical protein n=1 Tax=Pseudorhodobacter sp. W20_MBD10_FR17 TaxID=3240266 RepID=UPI003F9E24F5